jgi:superfamily II DNA or RNA helicase
MSLVSKLAFQVEKQVQLKGYTVFNAKRVTVFEESPISMMAYVQGEERYTVALILVDSALEVECSCPAYAQYGPCKHIWAAILEADRRGALSLANQEHRLLLREMTDPEDEDDDAFDDDDDDIDWDAIEASIRNSGRTRAQPPPRQPPMPLWKEHLQTIATQMQDAGPRRSPRDFPKSMEVAYVLGLSESTRSGTVVLSIKSRNRKQNGEWSVFKDLRLPASQVSALPDPQDQDFVSMILGGKSPYGWSSNYSTPTYDSEFALSLPLTLKLLPAISALGRLWITVDHRDETPKPLTWDPGEPWQFQVSLRRNERDLWEMRGELRRGDDRLAIKQTRAMLATGIVIHGQTIARFEDSACLPWVRTFRSQVAIQFTDKDREEVLHAIFALPTLPRIEAESEFGLAQQPGQPRFGVRFAEPRDPAKQDKLEAVFLADYGDGFAAVGNAASHGVWLESRKTYVLRQRPAEEEARQLLAELGVRLNEQGGAAGIVSAKAMPKLVRELIARGWHVEAKGGRFRKSGSAEMRVSSGIDWFELHGAMDFEGEQVSLPDLLAALKRGDGLVKLGDGSFGMLPEEWLQRFAPVAALGEVQDQHLRFRLSQATLLDALLASQPKVSVDEQFERARERMRSFAGVQPARQPKGFQGALRHYQLEGLGWIEFLREFGFGGILADDMGVGKTAQVLAALEQRRTGKHGPSLVVAPRSLLFNWRQESERFTPKLRVLEHAGQLRDIARIDEFDLVLTTYGTLNRDVTRLAEREFDYVILDEAQAVKNANTVSAKAVRLLRAKHRLALSGTPVENHLGELWSLFEFLNPGMLGEAKVLKMTGGLAKNPSEETRRLLASALRPYILRRTKQQVAKELPEKTEQTIFCEMEGDQLHKYNQLKEHYRNTLLSKATGAKEWNKMKMHVLEALLRLRQAASHPGLLDPKMAAGPSAKFATLLEQLEELREEGHKALVFSQFTSLLALLKQQLDKAGFRYEYLDGETQDRQGRVERFQNDPACDLFLISLRAGGVGLNLTAAEYVFLLDPWWNPAVEAQAIDRAHRIGQTRNVFAYRLIARGTVEEKVLELQKSKRDLADAILNADGSPLRDLRREDLEMLLS